MLSGFLHICTGAADSAAKMSLQSHSKLPFGLSFPHSRAGASQPLAYLVAHALGILAYCPVLVNLIASIPLQGSLSPLKGHAFLNVQTQQVVCDVHVLSGDLLHQVSAAICTGRG
jgi:hypothetical protein